MKKEIANGVKALVELKKGSPLVCSKGIVSSTTPDAAMGGGERRSYAEVTLHCPEG